VSWLDIQFEDDIKLVLSREIIEQLRICVNNSHPNEACGIIFGEITQIVKRDRNNDFIYYYRGTNFECIQSERKSTVAFLIENIEKLHEIIQSKVQQLNLKGKNRLISIFHSHPSGSYPSSLDLNQMKFLDSFSSVMHRFTSKAFKNLVWTIMDGITYELRGFIYINPKFFQIEVVRR